MKPVTQTRTGWGVGNCTEAAIASVLECALEDVPDLLDPAKPGDREETFLRLCAWLRDRGLMWVAVEYPPVEALDQLSLIIPEFDGRDGYHLIGGLNAGGVGHMVVGQGGRVVWDPNPSRAGLVVEEDATFLLPLDWIPAEYRHGPAISIRPQVAA